MSDLLLRVVALGALVALSAALWWLLERHRGILRLAAPSLRQPTRGLPVPAGRWAVIQFSSSVCATCPRALRTWREAAGPTVTVIELDAAVHLDLARRMGILRTPTAVLVDDAGAVVGTVRGAPTAAQARAALAALPMPS